MNYKKHIQALLERVQEFMLALSGNRKCGAILDVVPEEEIKPRSAAKKLKAKAQLDAHGLLAWENFYNQYQGSTPHCVAFTIAHALSYMLTSKYSELITIEGTYIATLLIEAGIMTSEGASIRDSVKYITEYSKKHGIRDSYHNRYKIEDYEAHDRRSALDLLKKGYPIVFGDMVGSPMCDERYVLRSVPSSQGGGHAFMGAPIKATIFLPDDGLEVVNGENSWKKFGIPYDNRKGYSGQFHIPVDDLRYLFTPHIFTDVSKV